MVYWKRYLKIVNMYNQHKIAYLTVSFLRLAVKNWTSFRKSTGTINCSSEPNRNGRPMAEKYRSIETFKQSGGKERNGGNATTLQQPQAFRCYFQLNYQVASAVAAVTLPPENACFQPGPMPFVRSTTSLINNSTKQSRSSASRQGWEAFYSTPAVGHGNASPSIVTKQWSIPSTISC